MQLTFYSTRYRPRYFKTSRMRMYTLYLVYKRCNCLFTDSAGYIPAAAVSVPTSPHAAAVSYPNFFPSPVVMSSQMLKNVPTAAQGVQCILYTLG